MRLSPTSEKILSVFFGNLDQKFYINELIRETSLYPNSVYQAIKTLEKQEILKASREGRLKFYTLNRSYKYLPEIENIICGRQAKNLSAGKDGIDWVKILNRQASYSFSVSLCVSNVENLKKIYGFGIPTFWYNSITSGVYYPKNELILLGKSVSKKIESDSKFSEKDIALCRKTCDELVGFAKKIPLIDLPQKSGREMSTLLRDFYLRYLEVFPFVTAPHGIENYFETKIRQEVDSDDILKILFSPVSVHDEEQAGALKIAAYVKENGFNEKFHHLINKHCENFCWLPLWNIHAEPLTVKYFEDEIKNIIDKVKDPKNELKRLEEEEKKARRKLQETFEKISATPLLIQEIRFLQEYICLRIYRKNAICQAHYYHLPLLYEAGRRLNLNSEEIKLLSYKEITDGLSGNIPRATLAALVKDRQIGWAILMIKGKVKIITGVKEIIEAMERFQIVAPTSAMQRVVRGNVASRGRANGKVKIVKKLSELSKVEQGDILVAKMTTPDYVMAMRKAAAIVTDEGGVTCHAAIVSREFNIPCIVGTRNATQILTDNDTVEVDAIEGVVRVIEAVEVPEDIKVISGRTIFKGKVKGRARIILDASDFSKVKTGDILIAPQTTPEYLSSLYRVKGFIVDEESLTSHAVLYGKALRLPSIMGTSFARNVIRDGEMVELDATNGLVKRVGGETIY
jgi:phosphohistidine swiveling domain-containing protein/DNA-binding transcriptional ArsR family regulator